MPNFVIIAADPFKMTKAKLEQIIAAHGNMKVNVCTDNMAAVDTNDVTAQSFRKLHKGWMIEPEAIAVTLPNPRNLLELK